jgi:hypothetical protein
VYLSGRVTTALNLLVFIAAFAGQWAIGAIIDFFTHGDKILSPEGFKAGFLLLLIFEFAGFILYVFIGRKHNVKAAA